MPGVVSSTSYNEVRKRNLHCCYKYTLDQTQQASPIKPLLSVNGSILSEYADAQSKYPQIVLNNTRHIRAGDDR